MISIVICTYNNAEYLTSAINSVIAQTNNNWELVIIDDGSTDDTTDILAGYTSHPSIRVETNPENHGKAWCLNQALEAISGEWMLELDADDWLEKHCIEKLEDVTNQVKAEVSLLYGNYAEWRERPRDKQLFYAGIKKGPRIFDLKNYLASPRPIAPRLYRVQFLKKINGWHYKDIYESRLYEDVYMICLLSKHGRLMHIDEVLYHRRLRINSISNKTKGTFEKWKQWLKKELNKEM